MHGKIVIAEDDKVTRQTLERVLAHNSFYVYGAPDGLAALELVRQEKPDILICDVVLPKLDGLQLCQRVKEDPNLNETKIIMMTAVYKGAAFGSLTRDCRADDYLDKPIDLTSLLEKIFRLCGEVPPPGKIKNPE